MMTTVVGTFTLPSSDPEGAPIPDSGTVRFSLASSAVLQDAPPQIVTTADVVVTLDDEGAFSVDLIPSDSPLWATEDPVPYTVTLTLSTTRTRYSVLVPTSGSAVDLADLLPLGSPPDVVVIPGPTGPPGGVHVLTEAPADPSAPPEDGTFLWVDSDDNANYQDGSPSGLWVQPDPPPSPYQAPPRATWLWVDTDERDV